MLVRGAVGLARRLGVSTLLIALSVVAFGTSTPELVVCLDAALGGVPDIATGNVVGSNIANILLILGTAAVITPIAVASRTIWRDAGAVLAATVLFVGLGQTGYFGPWDGALLVFLLIAYLGFSYRTERGRADAETEHDKEVEELQPRHRPLGFLILITLGGLAALVYGADVLVAGATEIARAAGVSETVIGLTLVAFGTSLPELSTCAVAAYRRAPEVALGNVLGSNMFNILGITGVVGLVADLPVSAQIAQFDGWFMLAITVLLVPLLLSHRRIARIEGAVLVLLYAGYIAIQYRGVDALLDMIA